MKTLCRATISRCVVPPIIMQHVAQKHNVDPVITCLSFECQVFYIFIFLCFWMLMANSIALLPFVAGNTWLCKWRWGGDSLNILPFAMILCHFNIECEKMKPQKMTKPPENAVLPKAAHTQDWINLHNIAVSAIHLYFHVISLWCGGDSHEPVKLAQNCRYYVQICNIHILNIYVHTHKYLVEGVEKQESLGKCLQTKLKNVARGQQYLRAESTL